MEYTRRPETAAPAPPPGDPNPVLLLVLLYLRLPELLSMRQVCRGFRDTVARDSLLWRELVVGPPLSGRLTDSVLWVLTSRARGKLRSLGLFGCWRVTDDGLRRVVKANPYISKLSLPKCFGITTNNAVNLVKGLANTNGQGYLERVWLHGISNVTKEHLDTLKTLVPSKATVQSSDSFFYSHWHSSHLREDNDHPMDIQLCPICNNVRMVFNCPREECRSTNERPSRCRACFFCIPRCEDCGVCLGREDDGVETVCSHLLCLQCLPLRPKCSTCNRPYCERDSALHNRVGGSNLSCVACIDRESYDDIYHAFH